MIGEAAPRLSGAVLMRSDRRLAAVPAGGPAASPEVSRRQPGNKHCGALSVAPLHTRGGQTAGRRVAGPRAAEELTQLVRGLRRCPSFNTRKAPTTCRHRCKRFVAVGCLGNLRCLVPGSCAIGSLLKVAPRAALRDGPGFFPLQCQARRHGGRKPSPDEAPRTSGRGLSFNLLIQLIQLLLFSFTCLCVVCVLRLESKFHKNQNLVWSPLCPALTEAPGTEQVLEMFID